MLHQSEVRGSSKHAHDLSHKEREEEKWRWTSHIWKDSKAVYSCIHITRMGIVNLKLAIYNNNTHILILKFICSDYKK